ncbi:E3 ubiquitin-protein ligase RMA1H1-like [Juglans microcarpa x Juglans regia]|uniref:E3 ubiquitin-protein ligase RMA1H1-like n=1 Tax=Juglans microcarpa x Juglans regia TaxID=2249226 RepID=UPI001B7E5D78|nr:E3 ubiquitin-protein ligase RMA1H1-like [Juglans microcarpa x Juglans regia]
MDIELFEEAISQNDSFGEEKSSLEKWKSVSDAIPDSENNSSGGFDCNICLETVQDPVVTLCGHLYCWPCIYKWLHFQRLSDEDQHQQCPVCKAEISQTSLVPLYCKGQTTKRSKGNKAHLGIVIPRRPLGPGCGVDLPRSNNTTSPYQADQQFLDDSYSYQAQQYNPNPGHDSSSVFNRAGTMTNTLDSRVGVFGEMVYARVFGNTLTNLYTYPNSYHLAGSNSPRVRRHVMQADKSLSRICFFLFCCFILCLLTF